MRFLFIRMLIGCQWKRCRSRRLVAIFQFSNCPNGQIQKINFRGPPQLAGGPEGRLSPPRSRPTKKVDYRPRMTASAFLTWAANGRFRRNRMAPSHSSLGFSRFLCMSGYSPSATNTPAAGVRSSAAIGTFHTVASRRELPTSGSPRFFALRFECQRTCE